MEFEKFIERELWFVDTKSGEKKDIRIEICRPYWKEPGIQAACFVCIRGLMDESLQIFGSDLLNAVECGLGFVQSELKSCPGYQVIQWPGGEPYFEE